MGNDYLNSRIGSDYKEKLEEISDKQERSMTGQLRIMIEETYEKVVDR